MKHNNCPLSKPGAPKVDYKNVELLRNYISEKGKIIPARNTNLSPQRQKELTKAIKRARFLSLLSYTSR